jgi:curli biogenesis system outer membrane secretion channel CsgG
MKRPLLVVLLAVTSCAAPRTTLRCLPPESPLSIAVLDFVDRASSHDPALGSRTANRLTHELFHRDHLLLLERGQLTRALEEAGIEQGGDLSTREIVAIGSLLEADVLIIGSIDEYEQGNVLNPKQRVAISLELLDAATGDLVGVTTYRRESGEEIGKLTEDVLGKMATSVVSRLDSIERDRAREQRREKKAAERTAEEGSAPAPEAPPRMESPRDAASQSKSAPMGEATPPTAPQEEPPPKREPAPMKGAGMPDTTRPAELLPWQ